MKHLLPLLLLTAYLLFLPSPAARSQELTLYGEGIIPTGSYGSSGIAKLDGYYRPVSAIFDKGCSIGSASYGWGAGFQIAFPMATRAMDLVADAGFRMNWLDNTMRTYFNDYAAYNHSEGITKAPLYLNIPLMLGPRVNINLFDNFGLYAALTAGINIRVITNAIFTPDYYYNYRGTCTLALRASAGMLISQHLRIEAGWSWLGDKEVKAIILDDDNFSKRTVLGRLRTTQFSIRLGWSF